MALASAPATPEQRAAFQHQAGQRGPIGWPEPLDLAELALREPELPRMLAPDWLPAGYATLLAGHGGVGKSGIALHLALCMASGLSFFGLPIERRRVMYLSCEDRENVLHWRLSRISRYVGTEYGSLQRDGWLDIRDLVGYDSVLWERSPITGYALTGAYSLLEQRMRAHESQVLFVDGISDVFGGNENAKTEVKRFVNALVALIPADSGAVLLVGHLNKPTAAGASTTEGYSGSTAWHNSVRARWYLYPETAQNEDGERPERTGDLILELQKSNMGRVDQSMRFAWDEGAHMFVGREIVGATAADRAHRDRLEHKGILRALQACADAQPATVVPSALSGPRTAYSVLSARPEFPDSLRRGGRASTKRFRRCIESLRQSGALIEAVHVKDNRHKALQLVLTPEGLRQCAT